MIDAVKGFVRGGAVIDHRCERPLRDRLHDWGRPARGHAGIRQWDLTDNIGKQSRFELVDIAAETEPDTYLVHLKVTGNGFNGTRPFRFTLHGGLIQSVVIVPD